VGCIALKAHSGGLQADIGGCQDVVPVRRLEAMMLWINMAGRRAMPAYYELHCRSRSIRPPRGAASATNATALTPNNSDRSPGITSGFDISGKRRE
jgi:hypothetical protein